MFNRPIVPLSTVEATAEMLLPLEIEPMTDGKGEWLNTSVYVFHPDTPLKGSVNYRISVKAGVKDSSGSELAEDYTWQFTTTAPSIDEFQALNLATNPEDQLADVPLDQKFMILFRQPMDKTSAADAFSL